MDDPPAGGTAFPPPAALSPFSDFPYYKKLSQKSTWMIAQLKAGVEWPEHCVAWPWAVEPRRHTMNFKGEGVPVTHVVLFFSEGPRPSKKHQGLHSCDVLWCINAKHLRWGTELQNRMDQVARQRGSIGKSRIGLGKAYKVRDELLALSQKYDVTMEDIARIAGTRVWADEKWETTDKCM